MSNQRPSDVGFCVVDDNADLIANTLVRRLRDATAEMESEVNRLYRGRGAVDLTELARIDLDKAIRRLRYMADTLREVQAAQGSRRYLEAAE